VTVHRLGHMTTPAPPRDERPDPLKTQIRSLLARYRHPSAVNGQCWTEDDVDRLARMVRHGARLAAIGALR
jgi:hypothetical protein